MWREVVVVGNCEVTFHALLATAVVVGVAVVLVAAVVMWRRKWCKWRWP